MAFLLPQAASLAIPNISFCQGYDLWRFIDTQVHSTGEKSAGRLSWISGTEDGLLAY
jgi:hypothetical protein